MAFDQFGNQFPRQNHASRVYPQVIPGVQHRIVTAPVHLWCTLETQRFPMVFNDFHVAHSTRSSRSERACRGPLRCCVAVGGDHTMEMSIFPLFYKAPSELLRFWLN